MLYYGCQGDDVIYLQDKLQEKGYDLPRYGSDGYYGNETETAVRELSIGNSQATSPNFLTSFIKLSVFGKDIKSPFKVE